MSIIDLAKLYKNLEFNFVLVLIMKNCEREHPEIILLIIIISGYLSC